MIYEEVTIKDICKIKSGKRLPKGANFAKETTDFPYIRARDIKAGTINGSNLVYLTEEAHKKIKQYIVNAGDIVITIVGASVGDVGYVKKEFDGFNLTENAVRLTDFDERINSQYLFYILNSRKYWELMQQIAGGSAQPKLGIYKVESIPLKLPPINVQKRIVNILSTYDDLIENNQKQIKLLEEAAQRLYKEWFIDFHFPGYEDVAIIDGVPEGWKKIYLKDIIDYEIGGGWGEEKPIEKCDNPAYVIRGTDLLGLTHGNLLGIPYRYHEEKNLKARTLIDGDIIFEVSGGSKNEGVARTALIRRSFLNIFHAPIICASFCKLIRTKRKELIQYLYDTFQYMRRSGKTAEYDKRSASSIVNYRWKDFLSQEEILIPGSELLNGYNKIAETMYYTIIIRSKQIETAKNARNRLLIKLMNGELEV